MKTGKTAHHALHFLQPGKAVRLSSCVIDALQRGAEGAEGTHNPITALAAASHMLLVGRSSGEVQCYTLPDLVAAGKHTLHVYSLSLLHLTCCSCLCPSDIVSAGKHLLLPNPCFLQLLVLICWANCPHSAVGIISCHSHSVSRIQPDRSDCPLPVQCHHEPALHFASNHTAFRRVASSFSPTTTIFTA